MSRIYYSICMYKPPAANFFTCTFFAENLLLFKNRRNQTMTEKEKRDQGLLYDANNDKELLNERQKCKQQCCEYNRLPYEQTEERKALLAKILGKAGKIAS